MFDDYGGINHRSSESARKSIVKTPYLQRPFPDENHRQVPIIPDDGGSQKGGTQVMHVGHTPPGGADGPPSARAGGVGALAHRGQPAFAYFNPP